MWRESRNYCFKCRQVRSIRMHVNTTTDMTIPTSITYTKKTIILVSQSLNLLPFHFDFSHSNEPDHMFTAQNIKSH